MLGAAREAEAISTRHKTVKIALFILFQLWSESSGLRQQFIAKWLWYLIICKSMHAANIYIDMRNSYIHGVVQ